MINNNILTFLVFKLFRFGYFTNPEFWPNLKKIALKTRCRKYPKRKSWKAKNVQMLLFIICKALQKIQPFLGYFWPFLPYFTW